MADGVVVKHNIPAFKEQMRQFGFDIQKNIVRSGVRAAGLVFKKRVTELAPESKVTRKGHVPGTLKKNIILARPKGQIPGQERQFVGVRSGRQRPKKGSPVAKGGLPFYWAWVETGHRIIPRGGRITGGRHTKKLKRQRFDSAGGARTKAVEYLKRAFQSVGPAALEAFNKKMQDRIDKENKKRTPRP